MTQTSAASADDAADIDVRQARREDDAAIDAVIEAAFGDRSVCDVVKALQRTWCWEDSLSFVAEQDGQIVGHLLFTHSWLDAEPRLVDVLVLSPLSVRPERQRRGIGAALMWHGLGVVAQRAEPFVFVEGIPSFYPKFGFTSALDLGIRKPSLRIPDAAFMARPQASYEPWMTGTLVYAEPWWRHDCVGLR